MCYLTVKPVVTTVLHVVSCGGGGVCFLFFLSFFLFAFVCLNFEAKKKSKHSMFDQLY